jgi:hypothetical protein
MTTPRFVDDRLYREFDELWAWDDAAPGDAGD